tara:strand:- start:370 stop:738 length:369 start_codon:yes stop_codon:yes gene_type:complete
MKKIDQLKAVLCDPTGKCCIDGSDEDRAIIDRALQALAQPKQAVVPFPSFMRKRIEQAMDDAIHPTGMSHHDFKANVFVGDLHRMLLVIDSVLAQPDLSIEANRVAYDVAMHYANKTKEKNA